MNIIRNVVVIKYYDRLCAEIQSKIKYLNQNIYDQDTEMEEYTRSRIKGLIDAFNILFDTYISTVIGCKKYIVYIDFRDKTTSNLIERIHIMTDDELNKLNEKLKEREKEKDKRIKRNEPLYFDIN